MTNNTLLFKEALDFITQTTTPPEVRTTRPTEHTLSLLLAKGKPMGASSSSGLYWLGLLVGIFLLLYVGIQVLLRSFAPKGLELTTIGSLILGVGCCLWALRGLYLKRKGNASATLSLLLNKEGAQLYQHVGKSLPQMSTQFKWQEISAVTLLRKKVAQQKAPLYCIGLTSTTNEELYLFKQDFLGQEVNYIANILRALSTYHKTGTIPSDWNKTMDEQEPPPFSDLSGHLIQN